MRKILLQSLVICSALLLGASAQAQAPAAPPAPPPPYGAPITLEQAMKVGAAALEVAKKNNWNQAIAVVEPSGALVYFEKIDGTIYASIAIAQNKAITAATFRRPSKAFQDRAAQNDIGILTLGQGLVAFEGGVPIVVGGKIIGAIGVSGAAPAQDGQVAQAGLDAPK
jgi:uncharacterized protein GlcG (DUF336 family)